MFFPACQLFSRTLPTEIKTDRHYIIMTIVEKNFNQLSDNYNAMILAFLKAHNVVKVVCNDDKEPFFDTIRVEENGLKVFKYNGISFNKLYFDFSLDYAKCLANMELALFLQQRNGKNNKYTFTFAA